MRAIVWIGGIAALGLIAAAIEHFERPVTTTPAVTSALVVPLATPVGILLQLGKPEHNLSNQEDTYPPIRSFADMQGRTLYVYDRDSSGKSVCVADCAQTWIPAAAPPHAEPTGDWSLAGRDDGTAQWVYQGHPLYSFGKDSKMGDSQGNGVDGAWHVAQLALPSSGHGLPDGIDVREVTEAGGQALIDGRGMTLYTFDGAAGADTATCRADACDDRWSPLPVPALANPTGDFSIVRRSDGVKQWAYRGRPLYTYDGDPEPGYANGVGADPQWHAALVVRYFMPSQVRLHGTLGDGKVVATAEGMTLYRRDAYRFEVGGHGLSHTGRMGLVSTGLDIGTKGCDTECLKTWHPLSAPADALPSGFWDIAVREDGTRQWVYKGYALYTYGGDKKPGDVLGSDIYDYLVANDFHKRIEAPAAVVRTMTKDGAGGSLYWAFAAP